MKILPESFGEILDGAQSFFYEVAGGRQQETSRAVQDIDRVAQSVHGVEPYTDTEVMQAQVQGAAPRVGRLASVETAGQVSTITETSVAVGAPSTDSLQVTEFIPDANSAVMPSTGIQAVQATDISKIQARIASVHAGTYITPQEAQPTAVEATPTTNSNPEIQARINEAMQRVAEAHNGYQEAA